MVEWLWPQEERPDTEREDFHFFLNKNKPGDIKKGILDDGWFLGALLIVATWPELFENILVSDPK